MGKSMARLGVWSVAAIVLLRLAVGWHFYTEGVKKFEPGFSAAGLLNDATGPLAPVYRSFIPKPGGYDRTLAAPRMWDSVDAEQAEENAAWRAEYNQRVAKVKRANAEAAKQNREAAKKGEPEQPLEALPVEFAPHSPYSEWAATLSRDWAAKRDAAVRLAGGGGDAKQQAQTIYRKRLQQLADYLAAESEAIEEYRHELWRLENLQASPGATDLDFREQRVADKKSETARTGRSWAAEVAVLEEAYVAELAAMNDGEAEQAAAVRSLRSPSPLDWINPVVTWTVIGVGGCMLLGLGTRLAAVVGAGFLLSVMASQPPWVPDANTQYLGYQLVEVMVMLVLAAVGAGRWFGIDSLLCNCCSLLCGPKSTD